MNKKILRRCRLFAGLDDAALERALSLLAAREQSYVRGEFLVPVASPMPAFGLVLEGQVQVLRDDRDGHHMIMANVGAGDTFGESLAYLGRLSPVYIVAVDACRVMWLSPARLADPASLADADVAALSFRFTSMLAARALAMNDRIQILSQLTIRSKINALLSQFAAQSGSDSFALPFDREDMAFYLGTDRSALSRELGRMRREGLIDFKGNNFTLLSPDFRAASDGM
ncbi:MAG: Crp/Fnr family transcriptional regulator [Clostridia bacterium]|nr:Crp/Fnr family transcriptional regulator [Clostridia bacterium]